VASAPPSIGERGRERELLGAAQRYAATALALGASRAEATRFLAEVWRDLSHGRAAQ
jgi:hypothetical protein